MATTTTHPSHHVNRYVIILLLCLSMASSVPFVAGFAPSHGRHHRRHATTTVCVVVPVAATDRSRATVVWSTPGARTSRRDWCKTIGTTFGAVMGLLPTTTPRAAEAAETDDSGGGDPLLDLDAFEAVKVESQQGIATLTERLEAGDYPGLVEFCKTYDLKLRKYYMGRAKKTLPEEDRPVATVRANAVTFDLIGINRNARPGQENYDGALKYIQELQQDVQKFLDLRPVE